MIGSRSSFLAASVAIERALAEPVTISKAPSEREHNERARVLRNGLAVVEFASLESFTRSRIGEILDRLSSSSIPFSDLPEQLRIACVFRASRAVAYQADLKRRQGEDFVSFVQNQSVMIASTASAAYSLCPLSLLWETPNLGAEDLKQALRVFGVRDGWGQIDALAQRIGMSSLPHREAFASAAARRHSAAHSADADSEWAHVNDFVYQARGVAVGFDALVSLALKFLVSRDAKMLSGDREVCSGDVGIRFVDESSDGYWRERDEATGYVFRKSRDRGVVQQECLSRGSARDQLVLVRNVRKYPIAWYTPAVD